RCPRACTIPIPAPTIDIRSRWCSSERACPPRRCPVGAAGAAARAASPREAFRAAGTVRAAAVHLPLPGTRKQRMAHGLEDARREARDQRCHGMIEDLLRGPGEPGGSRVEGAGIAEQLERLVDRLPGLVLATCFHDPA